MKLTACFLLLLSLKTYAAGQTVSCFALVEPVAVKSSRSANKSVKLLMRHNYMRSEDGQREMAYVYKPGANKTEATIIIHGLGHDGRNMQAMTESLLDLVGWDTGILMPDLYGHGATHTRMKQNPEKLALLEKENYSYQFDIIDIIHLAHRLGLKKVKIIGHSLGGAVTFGIPATLVQEKTSDLIVEEVTLLGPYAQREDVALAKSHTKGHHWVQQTAKQLINAGVDKDKVDSILDPYFQLFSRYNFYPQLLQDIFYTYLGMQKVKDFLQDPVLDQVVLAQYKKYFEASMQKELGRELNEEEKVEALNRAEVSLKKTKSLRNFDMLYSLNSVPDIKAAVHIIGGINDTLVIPTQLKELFLHFKKNGLRVTLDFVTGHKAGHFFVQTMPDETAQAIVRKTHDEDSSQ